MFVGELRPFQIPAVERMVERGRMLVAYEMGLGKTVLTIAALEELFESDLVDSGLVLCTASLKYQWAAEIEKFTDGARVLVIDGTPTQRAAQYAKAGRAEYVIMTYGNLLGDWEQVQQLQPDFVVADECTAIKSFRAKRSVALKKLHSEFKYGLTGQPVENRAEELFSIMQWVDKDVLGRFDIFDRTFLVRDHWGKVKRATNLRVLHERMSEAMVRKRKSDPDVAPYMPQVVTENLYVTYDPPSAKLYRRIIVDILHDLDEMLAAGMGGWDLMAAYGMGDGASGEMKGKLMAKLGALRMLCDHPHLLQTSADHFRAHTGGSQYVAGLLERVKLPTAQPKLDALVEIIEDVLSEDEANKIVVFASFKEPLRLIAAATHKLTNSVQFTGDMSAHARDTAKRRFQTDPGTRLFLSSDAGGYGVDLPQANYLINFDLPWSAGKLDQRNARIIRLSTEFDTVTLINILMKGSIEERMLAMLTQKRLLASAMVDGIAPKGGKGSLILDTSTLREFLESSTV